MFISSVHLTVEHLCGAWWHCVHAPGLVLVQVLVVLGMVICFGGINLGVNDYTGLCVCSPDSLAVFDLQGSIGVVYMSWSLLMM